MENPTKLYQEHKLIEFRVKYKNKKELRQCQASILKNTNLVTCIAGNKHLAVTVHQRKWRF